MESKKVNIFAFLMTFVMCIVSVCVCVNYKNDDVNVSNDILSIYKKLDDLDDKIEDTQGDSAYEIAVNNGFNGTEKEWLMSLQGSDGKNALTTVTTREIFDAYKTATNQTETYSYEDFLTYYYSVVEKNDTNTATQLAYSTTVDICYSYTNYTYEVQQGTVDGETAYKIVSSGKKGGVAAGAGVIYKMLDTNGDTKLDTAYIITNYHVAYLENYSNDPNYIVYYNSNNKNYFLGSKLKQEDIKEGTESSDFGWGSTSINYFLESSIEILTTDNGISKHFLTGTDDEYYGIYLYGYQEAEYKLNATFVGGSADNDIAVLKIDRNDLSDNLAKIFFDSGYYFESQIGDSSKLVGGEEVIAVGNPLMANTSGLTTVEQYENAYIDALILSSTSGIVSSTYEYALFESLLESGTTIDMRLIRVDAAINSGNSGGGLYNLYGELVGIVNSKMASSNIDNVGYAIPINVAVNIAEQVIKQCEGEIKTSTNTRIKSLNTDSLGFSYNNGSSNSKVVKDSNGNNKWSVSYNIVVDTLTDGGLAKNANLEVGDIILSVSFDEKTYLAETYFNQDFELDDLLLKVETNCTQLVLKVYRNSKTETITINLDENCFTEIV